MEEMEEINKYNLWVKKENFLVVKFSSKKKGKEQNISKYDLELILNSW